MPPTVLSKAVGAQTSSAKLRRTIVAPPTRSTGESQWCPGCGEPLPESSRTCPRCLPQVDQDTSLADSTPATTAFPLVSTDAATGGAGSNAGTRPPTATAEAPTYDDPSEAVTMEPSESQGQGGESRARTASQLNVGDEFGTRYRISRFLGMGGMGAVYLAWTTNWDSRSCSRSSGPIARARAPSGSSSANWCWRGPSRTGTSSGFTISAN